MAVSFHKRDELYAERANLKGQIDALLPKIKDGDAAALESFGNLEAKVDALTENIKAAEAEIKSDLDARQAALAHREAVERAEKLARTLGEADPRAKAAADAASLIARSAPTASDRTAAAATSYNGAFMKMLAFGWKGLSQDERASLGNPREFSEEDRMALRDRDPELFSIISSGDDVSGGYLIPAEPLQQIEMAELAYSGMLEAPTRKFTTATGREIPIPTLNDTGNSGAWVSELADHSGGTDPQYGVKTIGAHLLTSRIVKVSKVFLTDAGGDFAGDLFDMFGERLGRAKNTAFTTGNGVGKPTGVVSSASSSGVTAAASSISFNDLTDLEHSVNRAYRRRGSTGYMAADSTIKALKKLLDGDGKPIWQLAVKDGQPDTLNGWPYWINDDIAEIGSGAKSVLYGDWSKYRIRTVGGSTLVRLNERFAELHQVGFVLIQRVDGLLVDGGGGAIKYLANA